MPELPDIELYLACLRPRIEGQSFSEVRFYNPFALRTVSPKPAELVGQKIVGLWRIGKRVAFEFESGTSMVIHLMVSGRFRWLSEGKPPAKITHASWKFPEGTLALTEAASRKKAGVWILPSVEAANAMDPGGLEPLTASPDQFREALLIENRTLKRALTNPKRFSGIGNAYSDEILHAAKLSPLKLTQSLEPEEIECLHQATMDTLTLWSKRLLNEFDQGQKFPGPGQVTAFRPNFAVHGKYNQPCPVCGKPVQRIVYAENETNYCAVCQNGGRILADRSLSRLLKDDWPRSFAEEEG